MNIIAVAKPFRRWIGSKALKQIVAAGCTQLIVERFSKELSFQDVFCTARTSLFQACIPQIALIKTRAFEAKASF